MIVFLPVGRLCQHNFFQSFDEISPFFFRNQFFFHKTEGEERFAFQDTVATYKRIFEESGVEDGWKDVVAVVVQPEPLLPAGRYNSGRGRKNCISLLRQAACHPHDSVSFLIQSSKGLSDIAGRPEPSEPTTPTEPF